MMRKTLAELLAFIFTNGCQGRVMYDVVLELEVVITLFTSGLFSQNLEILEIGLKYLSMSDAMEDWRHCGIVNFLSSFL